MFSKNPLINLIKYCWHYSFGIKKWFVFFVVFSVVGNVVWLLQPIVIGRIFDAIQFADHKNQITYIGFSVLSMIVINIVGWIFHGTSRIVENKNAFLIRKNYRQDMFEKVMDLPAAWHKDHHSGDTIDKINKAGERLFDFASEFFVIIQNVVGLTASIAILLAYDVRPVVIALFSSVISVIVIFKFDQKLIKSYRVIYKAENFVSAGIFDYISNYMTIISLRLKDRAVKEMDDRSMKPFAVYMQSRKINELKWFLSSFIISLMTASVLFLNAYSSYKSAGLIAIGTLFVLYQYLNRIGDAFYTFAWKYSDIVRQNAAIVAAEAIQNEYEKLHTENITPLPEKWNVIQIKKLSFTYRNESNKGKSKSLDDISIKMERNQKIALIGMSGSGKSTMLSLLRGMHEPDGASVYCDGKKMQQGLLQIQNSCTLIPQEAEIFNNTIEYNITMGVHMNRKHLEEVIKCANLSTLVARLKQGLKTSVLEKGVSLSGGEKQRLALARGLLAARDSEFLLLDEPTSSMDVENELQIYQNIFGAFKDKVIISAIHSLYLLRNFDYIYMFKEGKIVAQGNFETLLSDECFKELWENYSLENEKQK